MCGGGGWDPLRNIVETGGSILGNYLLPGSSLLTDQLVSKGSQNQLNSPLGELAQVGTGLAGAGFGSGLTGIPSAASVGAGYTNIANGLGNLIGDSTLGTDIGTGVSNIGNNISQGLSSFSDSSGLSSFLGGTPQPTDNFTSDFNLGSASNGGAAVANQASTPALGQTIVGGGSPSIASGGSTLVGGGIESPNIGENLASPSASGGFGSGVDFSSSTPANISNQFSVGGISPADSITNSGLPSSGNILDMSALNAPIGSSSGGNNVGTLGSLFGNTGTTGTAPSAGNSALNGLLRGGLGYLFNQPNTQGANAINSATQQAQANYAPYLTAGNQAENTLSNLYGNNGSSAQTTAQQNFANTPGYQFALNQGLNSINANAAAMGNPLSGNNEEAINNYAQGAASQNYNNYVNQLQNQASGGLTAATGSGNAGLTGAGAISGIGQNNANNANAAIGQGLQGLFPTGLNLQQLLGTSANNNSGGILSYLGL